VRPLVTALEAGALRPEAFERALDALLEDPGLPAEVVLAEVRGTPGDGAELERLARETAERATALGGRPLATVLRWAMGQVMPEMLGRVAPDAVRAALQCALAQTGGAR
jgi:Asp-tRNA(Asn)/Glu-tRNA(Gln) amidotransferase B subunit